jgi:hypothetical protein
MSTQEFRAKKSLYAPARSVLRGAEGSVFGWDFFRLLRNSKDGAGCLLLVFLTVGLAIFSFGLAGTVGPYAESLQSGNDPRSFLGVMAFGTVFFLVALRMLQIVLTEARNKGRGKRIRDERRQPWTVDHPWKPGGMPPDYSGEGGGSVLGRVAIFGLFGLFNMVFLSPSPWLLRGIVLLFDLFALLILWDSLHKIWQDLRHPRPKMRWMTFPAFLGDRLLGVFMARPALRVQGPVRATLRAIRDEGFGTQAEAFILYEQVREFPNAGDRLSELPLSFDIPRDLPGTDLSGEQPTYWQVHILAPVAGPDFETVFLAPVYKGPDGPPAWKEE